MSKSKTIKMIFSYIRKYWYIAIAIVLLALIYVLSTLFVPVYIGDSIDAIIKDNVDYEIILSNITKIGILIIISFISQWLLNICNNIITINITRDIRRDAFQSIIRMPLSYIDTHPFGEIVSKVIADVDAFADGLLMGFTQLFTGIATILGTLVFMLTINFIVALIVVILTPISIFVAKFIASRIHKYFTEQSESRARETAFVNEMINNIKVVQAFSHEDENMKEFKKLNEDFSEASLKAVFFSSLVNPCTRFVNALIYAAVCLSGALIITIKPWNMVLSIGKLTTLLSYSKEYMKPFNEISGVITELQNAFICAERVFELILVEPEYENKSAQPLENVQGDIQLSHVYFSYNRNQRLIEDLNLDIKKGMRVAIVGPTGSGKTTLINLLMRFYEPTSGEISIDEKLVTDLTKSSLRKNFGMVLQETWLKSGTILDNIRMGKPEATLEEVIKASKETHAHYFIEKMANGYNTVINENSDNLSAGERQLLCITRIMLLMPPMLILDEATSSIDTRTELKVQDAFQKLMNGKTSFIVAHRLQTIKEADLILVLKEGRIIEKGSHSDLIKKKGFYFELYNSQFNY